jgi:hypothetical protein
VANGVTASVPVTHSTAARDESEKDVVPAACLSLSRDPGILHDEHRHYREMRELFFLPPATRLARRLRLVEGENVEKRIVACFGFIW